MFSPKARGSRRRSSALSPSVLPPPNRKLNSAGVRPRGGGGTGGCRGGGGGGGGRSGGGGGPSRNRPPRGSRANDRATEVRAGRAGDRYLASGFSRCNCVVRRQQVRRHPGFEGDQVDLPVAAVVRAIAGCDAGDAKLSFHAVGHLEERVATGTRGNRRRRHNRPTTEPSWNSWPLPVVAVAGTAAMRTAARRPATSVT